MRPYREKRYLQVLRNTVGLNSFLGLFELCKIFLGDLHINHNEHTILLSRKTVNWKERKEWIVYLCLLLSYLMRLYRENRYLQVLHNTVVINSHLSLFALCKCFFLFTYKHCQCLYVNQKNFLRARRGSGTSLDLRTVSRRTCKWRFSL